MRDRPLGCQRTLLRDPFPGMDVGGVGDDSGTNGIATVGVVPVLLPTGLRRATVAGWVVSRSQNPVSQAHRHWKCPETL